MTERFFGGIVLPSFAKATSLAPNGAKTATSSINTTAAITFFIFYSSSLYIISTELGL